jgi:hypothetical protein
MLKNLQRGRGGGRGEDEEDITELDPFFRVSWFQKRRRPSLSVETVRAEIAVVCVLHC